MKIKQVFTATWEWFDIAQRQGLEVDFESEPVDLYDWDEFCRAAGFDRNDHEVGFSTLRKPRDCDTLLDEFDIVATQGFGGDVVFLRVEPAPWGLEHHPPRGKEWPKHGAIVRRGRQSGSASAEYRGD